MRRAGALAAVLAVTAAVYAPMLGNGFWADDYVWLERGVQAARDPWLPFTAVYDRDHNPLSFLSFVATFRLFGEQAPGWHAFDLAVHLACVALLFAVALRLSGSQLAAAVAALLFGTHVAVSEPVLWSSARVHSQALLGLLAAILAHAGSGSWRRDAAFAAALLAAFNCKETAVAYVGVLGAWVLWARLRGVVLPGRSRQAALAACLLAAGYVAFRILFFPGEAAAGSVSRTTLAGSATKLALTFWSFVGLDERLPDHVLLVALPLALLLAALALTRSAPLAFALLFALGMTAAHFPARMHSSRYAYSPAAGLAMAAGLAAAWLVARARSPVARASLAALLGAWLAWSAIAIQVEIRDYRRLAQACTALVAELAPTARTLALRAAGRGPFQVAFVDARSPSPLGEVVASLNGRQKLINFHPWAVAGMVELRAIVNLAAYRGRLAYARRGSRDRPVATVITYDASGRVTERPAGKAVGRLLGRRNVHLLALEPWSQDTR